MLSVVSYRGEIAQNRLIAALVGRPWHGDSPEGYRVGHCRIGCGCFDIGFVVLLFYHQRCHIVTKMLKMGR